MKITTENVVYADEGYKLQLQCLINRPFLNVTIDWKEGPNLQNASLLVQSHYGVVGGPHFRRGYDLLQNGSLLIEQYTADLQGIYYCQVRDAVGDEAYNSTNLVSYGKTVNIIACCFLHLECGKLYDQNQQIPMVQSLPYLLLLY